VELMEVYVNICNCSPKFGIWDSHFDYVAAHNFPGMEFSRIIPRFFAEKSFLYFFSKESG
jgi:hypothetical protein